MNFLSLFCEGNGVDTWSFYTQPERGRETQTQTDRERDRYRQTDRERDRGRGRERERDGGQLDKNDRQTGEQADERGQRAGCGGEVGVGGSKGTPGWG